MSEVYDYVIVGAGSAGCVLANRLSQNPDHKVCLLEAGGKDGGPIINTPMLLQFVITNEQTNWSYWTEPQSELENRKLYWPRGKVLGGSSSINAMHYMRGALENYQDWQDIYGAEGWTAESALEAFKRVENNENHGEPFHGKGGPLNVKNIDPVNSLTERYWEACRQRQLPENFDHNGARQDGFGVYQVTQKDGKRCSSANAFLHPVMQRQNLTVGMNTLVERVIIEDGKATGLRVNQNGQTKDVYARNAVILSGGAINSPHLLMLSGIGPADHLREHGISVEVDSPGVGQNLQDHLDISARARTKTPTSIGYSMLKFPATTRDVLQWAFTGKGLFTVNPVQGCGFMKSSVAGDLPDIQLVFVPGIAHPHGHKSAYGHGITLHACHLYPQSRGHLFLKSADPRDPIGIQPNYLSKEDDVIAMTDALEIARDILLSDAFKAEFKHMEAPEDSRGDRTDLEADMRARSETLYHPTSTCAMGSDELSVLDSQCRVKGIKNLRVVDASAMPRIVGGNTNAPTIMLATRAADMILSS